MNKKMLRIILCVLLIMTLALAAACSKPAAEPAKEKTLLDKIKEAGVITVGNSPDYPPFETIDDKDNLIGFDIDLMNAIAAELGVKVEFKRLGFDTIITAVQNGQVNIGMSGFYISDERKQQIDFSIPYYVGGQAVVTTKDSGIKSLDDLNGKTVAVGMGTTGEEAAKENIKGANVKALDDYSTAFMMLKNGSAKAVVADLAVANEYISKEGFVAVDDPISYEENAIVIRKGNPELVSALDGAIKKLKDSGKIAELAEKWEM